MIPKIIHHVWPGMDPFKPKFHQHRISWVKNHPDWTFVFWRLDNLPAEIKTVIAKIDHFDQYNHTVKSDILRFLIVNQFGGVYVDTDMQCLKPLDDLMSSDFFCGWEDKIAICPSIFGSVAHSEILNTVISNCLDSIKSVDVKTCNQKPHIYSGLKVFSDTVAGVEPNPGIKILPPRSFYPIHYTKKNKINFDSLDLSQTDSYTVHHWSGMDSDGWVNAAQ